nr:ribosomal protein L22 [Boronia edwardsii]YP_010918027.1 ribosomal protein L22 [Boronia edwardsii]WAJ48864.1 ribosomal protein L22 [Boronia edwardsii]WAJ48865.1 ribosomal protein L22 [Boronia edwardsii]
MIRIIKEKVEVSAFR